MNGSLDAQYARTLTVLRSYQSAVVALSGGVDSSLALRLCVDALGADNVTAATAVSSSVPASEVDVAKKTAAQMGVEHRLVEPGEYESIEYRRNGYDRCFHCKSFLYRELDRLRRQLGRNVLVNGTNADDVNDHRPGLIAADNYAVRSPLRDSGLGKAAVRALARYLGVEVWDKPSSPCLASRIPYFQPVTKDKLKQIEHAEQVLRSLGFIEYRVRHHGRIALVELKPEEMTKLLDTPVRQQLYGALRRLGFEQVALSLLDFRSGNLNPGRHAMIASPA